MSAQPSPAGVPGGTAQIDALLERAEACKRVGDYQEGAVCARQAADLAARADDAPRRARALQLLGVQLFRLGELEDAARMTQLAVRCFAALGDAAGRSEALCVLALTYVELGLHDEALQAVTESLVAAQGTQDKALLCWAYNRFGVVHDSMDDPLQACRFLGDALTLARELGDSEALFGALNNLSENAVALVRRHRERDESRDAEEALRRGLGYAEEGVRLARRGGNVHQEAICLGNFGMLKGLAGEHEEGLRLLRQSTEISRSRGYPPLVLQAARYTAELLRTRGDYGAAIAQFRELLRTAPAQADKVLLLRVHRELAAACKQAGLYREALEEFEKFHALEKDMNSAVAETRARMLTGRLELENARLQAERARLEADLHRLRSVELEAEKHVLVARSAELDRRANEDPLTGSWNRRYVEAVLPALFEDAHAAGRPLSVAMGDIDFFKDINDRFGHAAGDQVLQIAAALLKSGCRPTDIVARYGGEEFVLVLGDTALEAAIHACERLRHVLEAYDWRAVHPDLRVTISFGVGDLRQAEDPRQLLARADAHLYDAKRNGRNRVEPKL